MSEAKTVFYLINEWDSEKTVDELVQIIQVIVDAKIVDELSHSDIPAEHWDKFMEITDTPLFAKMVREFFDLSKDGVLHNPSHRRHVTEIRRLVDLINQEKAPDLTGDLSREYLQLVLDIIDYYENTYTFIEKRESEPDSV